METIHASGILMTNQRIFVAVDMLVYGTQLILVEFANGVILPIILGLLFLRSTLMGSKQSGWFILVSGSWILG